MQREMSIVKAMRRYWRGWLTKTSNQSSILLVAARRSAVDVLCCSADGVLGNMSAFAKAMVLLMTFTQAPVPLYRAWQISIASL